MTKMGNAKKIITWVVVGTVASVIGKMIGAAVFSSTSASSPKTPHVTSSPKSDPRPPQTLESIVERLAANTNKGLPTTLNASTRLDRVDANGVVMKLRHTILDHELWQPSDVAKLEASLLSKVCNDEISKELLNNGATVIYSYISKDEKPIANVNFVAATCVFP